MHVPEKCSLQYVSTVRRDNSHKTLKVGIYRQNEDREVEVLNYLGKLESDHDGRYCVRRPKDSFEIRVPDGYHHCLVYDPLGQSLLEYVKRQKGMTLDMDTVRWIATYLLTAVDYLHTCGVLHTGEHSVKYQRSGLVRSLVQISSSTTFRPLFQMRRLLYLPVSLMPSGINRVPGNASMTSLPSTHPKLSIRETASTTPYSLILDRLFSTRPTMRD